jgi:hypothetical protein
MNEFERLGLDKVDLDTLTLRRLIELWIYSDVELVLICRTSACRRKAKVDLIDRIDRFGSQSTLGALRRRSSCQACQAKAPAAYLVIQSPRRHSDQWFPKRP